MQITKNDEQRDEETQVTGPARATPLFNECRSDRGLSEFSQIKGNELQSQFMETAEADKLLSDEISQKI